MRKMEELKQTNETERSNLEYYFAAALQPNRKGDYNHGHPDTDKKIHKKLAQERNKFRKWVDKLDLKNTAEYYRENVKTIQVTGAKKTKLQKKRKNCWLTEKEEPEEGPRLSQLEVEKRNHKKFLKLMSFLNDYSQTVCYEGSGLISVNPKKGGDAADDFIDRERAEKVSAANIFPVEQSGPNKGKLILQRDERGNIITDPTCNVQKAPFFIDFSLYTHFKNAAEEGHRFKPEVITQKEREEIKELFAVPPVAEESVGTSMKKFIEKRAIVNSIIKVPRDGQAAGNRDVLAVGAVPRKYTAKSNLEPFLIDHAGANFGKRRTAEDQKNKFAKMQRRGTLKSESFLKKFHEHDIPVKPGLLDLEQ